MIKELYNKYVDDYSEEKIKSIQTMLDDFESNNIISSERKEYYNNILNYCSILDLKYKK